VNARPKFSPDKEVVKLFEAAGVVEYLEYLQSGKRILWVNFKAGVARGLGLTVGVAVILGGLVWILTMLMDLPVVGQYFSQAKSYIAEFEEKTNYKDEFEEMNQLLQEIDENTEKLANQEASSEP